ncbi:MAG: Benzoate 1,2-dioxygenase alpha subunit, partial [Acidimicrobiia bacterium]|nr:Benzoate 1,2-dioxygenase alpha subunit [Acidimicrobiia bacterium]
LIRADAVHRRVYKDPAIFALEMDRIFKRTWVFVGHESSLPNPGDFHTMKIGTEPVIFVRSQGGDFSVLVNRCRHRAATVCQLAAGNTSLFRCHYHGWTYANDGALLAVPFPERYDHDVRPDLGLVSAPRVESYRGLVFASFNEQVTKLDDHLGGPARQYIDRWMDHAGSHPLVALPEAHQLIVDSNWKLQVENGIDGYHGRFTHRSFFDLMQRRTGKNVAFANSLPSAQAKAFIHGNSVIDPETTNKAPLRNRIATLPEADRLLNEMRAQVTENEYEELLDALTGAGINIGIFPNLQLIGIHVRRIDPIAVDRTVVSVRPLMLDGVPPQFNTLRLRYHEMFYGPAGFGQPDDLEMFARVDLGLDDTEDEWIRFARGRDTEEAIDGMLVGNVTDETPQRGQYREWLRLMTADDC